jgi:DNA-binding MarR family transcriptional regulator
VSEQTPWLSREELEAWMSLTAVLMTLPGAIDVQLKRDAGLNFFEYSILAGLSRAPGRARQLTALAHLASGSLSRVSHAVTRLEQQGWVRRRACCGEVRAVEAVLTDAGMAKLTEAAPDHVHEARRLVVDVLSPTQLDQLRRICRKLVSSASPPTLRFLDEAVERLP